jgi:hypothetical protein
MGSHGDADICLHLTAGSNYGNAFLSLDLEPVGVCVQFDSANAANNVWLGGTLVWTGAAAIVCNNASNFNRFICPNFGFSGTLLTGAQAATVLIEDKYLGTSPFGGILVSPPSGDGDVSIDSVNGNSAFTVAKHAGATRWQWGRNNASETGGNVGSDFIIVRYSDAGATLDNPVAVSRATGIVTLQDGLAIPLGGKCGLYGAVPTTQPGNSGSSAQNNSGTTNQVYQDTGFTGGIGSTPYTLGQLVAALKTLGAIAS